MKNEIFSYKVIANVGTLAQYPNGWSKFANWSRNAHCFALSD